MSSNSGKKPVTPKPGVKQAVEKTAPPAASKPVPIPATRFRVIFRTLVDGKGNAETLCDAVAAEVYRKKPRVLRVEAID